MAQKYRLVGSQDPASRIDRVLVESPTPDNPDGKVLELGGPAVELSAEQVAKLSNYARIEPSDDIPLDELVVDQPGVNRTSQSTDVPPDPGTTPDLDSLSHEELVSEVERVRGRHAGALSDVNARSSKQELRKALNDHYAQQGA
jgi:hypothetical protein